MTELDDFKSYVKSKIKAKNSHLNLLQEEENELITYNHFLELNHSPDFLELDMTEKDVLKKILLKEVILIS